MNKEECVKAMQTIYDFFFDEDGSIFISACDVGEAIEFMYDLIAEHFDNPPLKFEDLEPDMWIWDNEDKMYLQIVRPLSYQQIFVNYYYEDYLSFEDGRYYAREVKECVNH